MNPLIPLGFALVLATHGAFAATYYVDFQTGNDAADGTSPESAWRHSPGDQQAEAQPGAIQLQPGDIVRFKGGVQYQGEIYLSNLKGAEDRPIVFDGNSDGRYGQGPAILDGARMIADWRHVTSADEVDGNAKWREIMFADVDVDLTSNFTQDAFILHRDTNSKRQAPWQRLFLIDGEKRVLPIAQIPKPSDPFFPDMPGDFFKSPVKLRDGSPHEVATIIEDPERFTQTDARAFDGMFVAVHGGNNHVYFATTRSFDPQTRRLTVPRFTSSTYDVTSYAFFNSPRFIDLPGEWALKPLDDGKTRVYFLPETLENGQPVNIGYPVLNTALSINEASEHIEVRGFLMQRYAGGKGGVAVNGKGRVRPSHIRIADCEVRFMSGQSGISLNHSDNVTVENCYVHHCPGWTVGIYVNRVTGYRLLNTRVDYNSGSGIRHYEAKNGVLKNNVVLNHYGMHSSGLNFYEGCRDILFEGNYVQNVISINRSAERLTFRNNVIDSQRRNALSVALWQSGTVGGTHIKDVAFENNTFINSSPDSNWYTAIFVQGRASAPEGIIARNNVLSRLRKPFPGLVEGNIYLDKPDTEIAGTGGLVVDDPDKLFRAPANGDYRRKPGGPMMEAGADVPPPPATWSR